MARPDRRTQSNPADASAYIPALDGLRAVAILLVVLSHLGLGHVLPGAFGVTLFFFISGYLITRQLLHRLHTHGRIGFGRFYLRRALRLMPASLAYIAVAGCLYQWAGGRIAVLAWLSAVFYGANFYQLWEGFETSLAGVRQPFNILWSLAIEEHFYLVWPVILGFFRQSRWTLAALLGFCLLVLAWRWALFDSCFAGHAIGICAKTRLEPVLRYNRLYLGTDTRADSLAWGVVLAFCEAQGLAAPSSSLWRGVALGVLGLSFLLPGDFARYVLRTSLQGASLLILVPAAIGAQNLARRALSCRPALVVGRLSYSLYLWHWGALGVADWAAGRDHIAWLAIAAPLTVALATLSYLGIEQPMLRLRRLAGSNTPLHLAGP